MLQSYQIHEKSSDDFALKLCLQLPCLCGQNFNQVKENVQKLDGKNIQKKKVQNVKTLDKLAHLLQQYVI